MSDNDEESDAMAAVMGFASFGKITKQQHQKKAVPKPAQPKAKGAELPTDYMKVFEDSLRIARQRNSAADGAQSQRRPIVGPTLPDGALQLSNQDAGAVADAQDSQELGETDKADKTETKDKKVKKDKKEKKVKKDKKDKKRKKKDKEEDEKRSSEVELIGPPVPAEIATAAAASKVGPSRNEDRTGNDNEDDDEEGDDKEEEEDEADPLFAPLSRELSLNHNSAKPVLAIGADGSGSRLVTGGSDFSVRYWNFAGMDSATRSFKILEQPCGEHQIRALAFNSSSECVLIVSGSGQAKLYDRDGNSMCQTVKGYQYISNPRSTPGHTHALLAGCWHPRDPNEFMTCSSDTSVRLWDINNTETVLQEVRIRKCKSVAVPKGAQGRAVTPTVCAYSPDCQLVFAGCNDGSLQSWDRRRQFINNSHLLRSAHSPDTITSLAFSYDAKCLLSRSMDDSLKLWDMRQLKEPLFVKSGISTQYEQTSCGFSPNDRLFFTAACAPAKLCEKEGKPAGQLLFFDRLTLRPVEQLTTTYSAGVVRCYWHAKINQLLITLADGRANVLFDQQRSVNGAKLCAGRPAKQRAGQAYRDGFVQEALLTYDEDSLRDVRLGKRKSKYYEVDNSGQANSRKLHQAEAPLSGPGYGGKLGQKGATLHQYMLQQMVQRRGEDPADKDIRGAILRHQAEAEKNPQWTGVYARTQPAPVFQQQEETQKGQGEPAAAAADADADAAAAKRQRLA